MPTAQRGKYANLLDCWQKVRFQEQRLAVSVPRKKAMSQILFLHGFGQTERDSTPQLKALRTALPCSSILAPTYHPGGSVEATRVSVALAGLSEHLKSASGRTTHLVGYSFGGLLCALLAERHPELVDRVLLLAPAIDNYARNYAGKDQADWQMPIDFAVDLSTYPERPSIKRPTTLVHGLLDNDHGGSAPWRIEEWAKQERFAAVHLLSGVDHSLEPWLSQSPERDAGCSAFASLARNALGYHAP